MSKKVSICIPCYEQHGSGAMFLDFSLNRINWQTYKNIEVVISDHSEDIRVQEVAERWGHSLDIKYVRKRYNTKCPSDNMNLAMKIATGDYIKLLFQDDYLFDEFAIEKTVKALEVQPDKMWLVSASEHSNDGVVCYREFIPAWNDELLKGRNTISSPSVVTLRNVVDKVYFHEELIWLMDCAFYYDYDKKYGHPIFLKDVTVVNRTWSNQLTNTLSDEQKNVTEFEIIKRKYGL
jgi:glycosyltransferase involved in cell wall biosynthesis